MTLRTSVNEVIQALVKENNPQTDNLSADSQSNGENQSQQSNPSSSTSTQKANEKENWVLVESWRGIERPLPPRTRLLRGKKQQGPQCPNRNSGKNDRSFLTRPFLPTGLVEKLPHLIDPLYEVPTPGKTRLGNSLKKSRTGSARMII